MHSFDSFRLLVRMTKEVSILKVHGNFKIERSYQQGAKQSSISFLTEIHLEGTSGKFPIQAPVIACVSHQPVGKKEPLGTFLAKLGAPWTPFKENCWDLGIPKELFHFCTGVRLFLVLSREQYDLDRGMPKE